MNQTSTVGPAEIQAAAAILGGQVRRTPHLLPGTGFFGEPAGTQIACKLELLQHTGSFKPRGALHRALTSEIPDSGLIAASGGNHGLAVAWAARRLGVESEIFVPTVSPAAKVEKLRALGATVRVTGDLYADALGACRIRQAETGALDIHAYDHLDTIAGAGTIGMEIEQDQPGVDTVLVAVGGGGLASGVAAWFGRRAHVVTVEPMSSMCFASAIEAGEPVDVAVGGVAADSLGAKRVGAANWHSLTQAGAAAVTVTDDAIRDAQRRFWSELQLVVEPGGATAAAALWSGAYVPTQGERIAVIVCGANTDPAGVAT